MSKVHPKSRPARRRRSAPGTSPGTLVVDPAAPPSAIQVMAYGPQRLVEETLTSVEQLPSRLGTQPVVWVNIDGVSDVRTVERIGGIFSLHKLALEDVVNLHQRAKVEDYVHYLYIVARPVVMNERVSTCQLSLFLSREFVLTFQEHSGDWLQPIRSRIRNGKGRIREGGAGYLAYAILDTVVDHYFPVLEQFGEHLERLEDQIVINPSRSIIGEIHDVKRDLLVLRRGIWPLREMINTLLRERTPFLGDEDRPYLRDCYDHAVQIMDLVETDRELASGLMDVYLSSVSNRMNEVMKVLTMFAAVFIPLSFIAGLYGMNFDSSASPWNLPELHWYWGYPFALTLMVTVAGGLLVYFRRKNWLGPADAPPAVRAHGEAGLESKAGDLQG